ncbi:hypothetical protein N7490_003536 [Penicillium lividum]|nr:hypothetical protein N7490_003536 [Penicillium lividum]
MAKAPNSRMDFDVAIVCALQLEADAAEALFDGFWDEDGDRYGKSSGDQNAYRTGVIGNHNVVLAYMPGIGKGHAASVAASFRSSFQGIRLALIVGICGGVPGRTATGIFLGDVIIGDEIVGYDFGRRFPGGFRRKEGTIGSAASTEVQSFLQKLRSQRGREQLYRRTSHHLLTLQKRVGDYSCPGWEKDQLFEAGYHHKHHRSSRCKRCQKDEMCEKAQGAACHTLKCDRKRTVARPRTHFSGLDIHFGRVASGDTVMKSGVDRDRIAEEEDIIAFEMEGAGICNTLPCILLKGVSDYADSHKDKSWQRYAAGRAAACMKSLLEQWASVDRSERVIGPPEPLLLSEPLSEVVSPRPVPLDEGQFTNDHSTTHKNALQVLPEIEQRFKSTLAGFKVNRKYLPRDTDLRGFLKTQRVVFLGIVELIRSDPVEDMSYGDNSPEKFYLDGLLAIQTKLREIERICESLPDADKAKIQHGNKNVGDTLKHAVEDLASMIRVVVSLTPQPKEPRSVEISKPVRSSRGHREFQHFRTVQKAARSLYDAIQTACNAHDVHDVHLFLQPDLDETLSRVQFNLTYSHNSTNPSTVAWIKVESTIKAAEIIPRAVSTSIQHNASSLKRATQLEDLHYRSKTRKRIQRDASPASLQLLCPEIPFSSLPNFYLQRNLCTLVRRFSHKEEYSDCIGLLGDNFMCSHLAYMDSQPQSRGNFNSLSQLISLSGTESTDGMSLYERVRLSRYLATAVLYYHATPWLQKGWCSDNIHFFGRGSQTQGHSDNLLSMAMATSVHLADPPAASQSRLDNPDHIIRNPVLFGLGVILPSGLYRIRLTSTGGGTKGFADYFTAQRLADGSYRKVSISFKSIIKKCLHCDFGHGSDFTSPALQQAFYDDVIGGLERLEGIFEDLQLDDRETGNL